MFARISDLGRRLRQAGSCALAAVLALGLCPVTGFAEPAEEAVDEFATALAQGSEEESQSKDEPCVPGQALVLYRVSDDGVSARSVDGEAAALEDAGLSVEQTWDFSAVDEAQERGVISARAADDAAVASGNDLRVALVSREGADAWELVEELEALDFVEAAQPNRILSIASEAVNDTLYDGWQGYLTDGAAGIDLDAALAARSGSSTEANIVAVIDTGVDYTHPDLAENMWENPGIPGLPGSVGSHGYDVQGNDDDPMPGATVSESHGTHCAGIIAAETNNALGIAGVSSDTEIMALKVAGDDGSALMPETAIVQAYQYVVGALLAGENVVAINCSWGMPYYLPVLDYLVNQAGKAGALSVFAAGNSNEDMSGEETERSSVGLASPYAVVVAASGDDNALTTFSCYGETKVDLAAPGANILSTVSTDVPLGFFDPLISRTAGKELTYFTDFSNLAADSSGFQAVLARTDGVDVSEEEQSALTVEPVADAGYGAPGIRVALDGSKLSGAVGDYGVLLSWQADNPFLGSAHGAEDYAIGVTGGIERNAGSLDQQAFVYANVRSQLVTSMAPWARFWSQYDQSYPIDASMSALDVESETVTMRANVFFYDSDPADGDEYFAFTLAGFGIGLVSGEGVTEETSAYAPYTPMSGTSMAAPVIAGAAAQLAALRSDLSTLELRGLIVGSTTPVEDALGGAGKRTATDGHFDFAVAFDENAINANTYAVDADASTGTATVHGYALGDAQLTVDGAAVEVRSQSDDALVVALPREAFDGGMHRFDVFDASTGRTHRASYALPQAEANATLDYVTELPAGATSGKLFVGDGKLYFASLDGTRLCVTDDPDSGVWTELAAPGEPEGLERATVTLAWCDGTICAIAFDVDVVSSSGVVEVDVQCARYDAAANRWEGYQAVDHLSADLRITDVRPDGVVPAVGVDGSAYLALQASTTGTWGEKDASIRLYRFDLETGSAELASEHPVDTAEFAGVALAREHDGTVELLVAKSYGTVEGQVLTTLAYDPRTGAWTEGEPIEGVPQEGMYDALTCSMYGYENGALTMGRVYGNECDVGYVDLAERTWRGLGSYGTTAFSSGFVVSSAVEFEGRIYCVALDSRTESEGTAGALYALPWTAMEELREVACVTAGYADVDRAAWYHEAVDWAVAGDVMTGYAGTDRFGPDDVLTRAQSAQVLYNVAGRPDAGEPAFSDCEQGAWYGPAVAWAAREGVLTGYGDGAFGPNDALSREQLATVLWRLAGEPQAEGDLSSFDDAGAVSAWAREAMEWSVGAGVFRGVGDTALLDPQGEVTRAQMAAVMTRIAKGSIQLRGIEL